MLVIRPTCRLQFTPEDVTFILSTLGSTEREQQALLRLLADPATRDCVLDHESLFRAVLASTDCVPVSTRFYFYVLVRHVLLAAGITDVQVADYVAELLSVFAKASHLRDPLGRGKGSLDYVVDILAAMDTVDDRGKFVLRAHLANFTLFLSGVFPDWIERRRQRKAAPALSYYEEMGRASYRAAAHHRLARTYDLDGVFGTLSDTFHETRCALNEMRVRLLCMDDPEGLPEAVLSQSNRSVEG